MPARSVHAGFHRTQRPCAHDVEALRSRFSCLPRACAPRTALAQKAAPAAPKPPTNDDCLACHGDASATGPTAGRSPSRPRSSPRRCTASRGWPAWTATPTWRRRPTSRTPRSWRRSTARRATSEAVASTTPASTPRRGAGDAQSVAAACSDCHGTHEIRAAKDPESPTYHLNLPATCGRCHGNAEIIRKGRIAIGNVVAQFQDSIHGQALSQSGLLLAPNCSDCHGAHDIRRRTDPASRVFRTTVPATCGKCHEGIERATRRASTARRWPRGNREAPVCVELPHRARDPADRGRQLEAAGAAGVRHVPQAVDPHLPRHVPRPGHAARLRARRHVRRLPRRARHLPEGATRARRSRRQRRWRPAGSATRAPTRASRSTTRTPTGTTAPRNPLLFYAAKFMETLLVGVFLFFGVHTVLWFSRSVSRTRRRSARQPAVGGVTHGAASSAPAEPSTTSASTRSTACCTAC